MRTIILHKPEKRPFCNGSSVHLITHFYFENDTSLLDALQAYKED